MRKTSVPLSCWMVPGKAAVPQRLRRARQRPGSTHAVALPCHLKRLTANYRVFIVASWDKIHLPPFLFRQGDPHLPPGMAQDNLSALPSGENALSLRDQTHTAPPSRCKSSRDPGSRWMWPQLVSHANPPQCSSRAAWHSFNSTEEGKALFLTKFLCLMFQL